MTPPYHCGVVEVAGRWLPLTMLYVGEAARRAGLDVTLFDAMSRFEGFSRIRKVLREQRPDYVATTSITATVPAVLHLASLVKSELPRTRMIVGGVHPSFMAEEMLRASAGDIDVVVRGEGEETVHDLLRSELAGGDLGAIRGIAYLHPDGSFVQTPPRGYLRDLEAWPAAFDLADWPIYRYFVIPGSRLGAVSTSRGCNHHCVFCSQQKFWERGWRGRAPAAVAAEIDRLHRQFGVNVILVSDEYPTRDAARWEEILDRIIAMRHPITLLMETRAEDIVRDEALLPKYRKAGVLHVYVGLESTDQATLDFIGKELTTDVSKASLDLLRANGMLSETSFVLGFPEETRESIRRTMERARQYNPDMAHFLCITPWPYADLWQQMEDRVRVRDYAKYNLIEPVVEPHALTLRDLDLAILDCYREFYMGKMRDFQSFPDELRRTYMLSSMKLIMKSSFLVKKLGKVAMPPGMATMMPRAAEA